MMTVNEEHMSVVIGHGAFGRNSGKVKSLLETYSGCFENIAHAEREVGD